MASRPRILLILNRFVVGGPAADIIPLCWYLREYFEVLILYGQKEDDEIEPTYLLEQYPGLRLLEITSLRRTINPLYDIRAAFALWRIVRNYKPAIVHTHGAKSGVLGRMVAWLCRIPIIVHTFHGHLFHSYFPPLISSATVIIERVLAKITTVVVALSNTQKSELTQNFEILPPSKVEVIPLGYVLPDNTQSPKDRCTFRSRYGLQDTDVAIGIVGRLVPIKNLSFFVSICRQMLATCGQAVAFFIVGDGIQRKQIEHDLDQAGVRFNNHSITAGNRVVFTSWQTNISQVMNGLDIITLTSLNEGTPMSIIEAQFFKKPIVAADAGGVKDTVINGRSGFICEKEDLAEFCGKLSILVENGELRKSMGEYGQLFASKEFSKEKEVKKMMDLYTSLLLKSNEK